MIPNQWYAILELTEIKKLGRQRETDGRENDCLAQHKRQDLYGRG